MWHAHRGDALQSHTSVDTWSGQLGEGAITLTVELHEDQVPDFQDLVGCAAPLAAMSFNS
eukprot:scaffold156478_cov28-Tisochrysis_lutea.AAC.11